MTQQCGHLTANQAFGNTAFINTTLLRSGEWLHGALANRLYAEEHPS